MATTRDPAKLVVENRTLRAENRRLKAEARRLRARMKALAGRVDELDGKQADVAAAAERAESLLRWLRARMQVLEREIGSE